MLQNKAEEIVATIKDYENNTMSSAHVIQWVNQFEESDREFILDELRVIFTKAYLSKGSCASLLEASISYLAQKHQYNSIPEFISESIFLDLQETGKSQKELLALLDTILNEKFGCSLAQQAIMGLSGLFTLMILLLRVPSSSLTYLIG